MKRITKDELPLELSAEIIEILVDMALEFPKTNFDWAEVSEVLDERGQLDLILDKIEEKKKSIEHAKEDSKSEEQKKFEAEQNRKADEASKKFFDENGHYPFMGNMGEPVTLEDFKLRYGKYPPGYDENGNKI